MQNLIQQKEIDQEVEKERAKVYNTFNKIKGFFAESTRVFDF